MNQTSNIFDLKKSATELRKAGDFPNAKEVYNSLWVETKDIYDGAGLLHCLRKMDQYDDAIQLAEELENECEKLDWCRNEVIWTYTNGVLKKLRNEATLEEVLPIAERIMKLRPDGLAAKLVVFRVLKTAKNTNDWDTINTWVVKLNPNVLSTEPMKDDRGKEGWCDQSLWYNYRIHGLVEIEQYDEAIRIADEIKSKFTKEKKYFLRLKAKSLYKLKRFDNSIEIYEDICKHPKADWWLLQEYANVRKDFGDKEGAYKLMSRGAVLCSKLDMMVSFFSEFGFLCNELEKNEETYCYLLLSKMVREKNDWKVQDEIINMLNELKSKINVENIPFDIVLLHQKCKSYWGVETSHNNNNNVLRGRVKQGLPEKLFCFIQVNHNESYFCFKSDLPTGTTDGDEVTFKKVTSFDKKKNVQSWKAINILKIN